MKNNNIQVKKYFPSPPSPLSLLFLPPPLSLLFLPISLLITPPSSSSPSFSFFFLLPPPLCLLLLPCSLSFSSRGLYSYVNLHVFTLLLYPISRPSCDPYTLYPFPLYLLFILFPFPYTLFSSPYIRVYMYIVYPSQGF